MKKFIISILIIGNSLLLSGQTNSLAISKVNYTDNFNKEQLFLKTNSNLNLEHFWAIEKTEISNHKTDVLEAKKDFINTPLSLGITGRYSLINTNIIDDENVFQSNVRVGIQYKLLGNKGLFGNRLEKRKIDTEIELLKQEAQNDNLDLQYGNNYQNIIFNFNIELIKEADTYLTFLDKQLEFTEALYNKQLITYPKVLEVLKKINRLKTYRKQLKSYNNACLTCSQTSNPIQVFDINIQKIISEFSSNTHHQKTDSIHLEKVRLDYKIKKLPTLSLYAQHLISFKERTINNQVPSIGFSFNMPLFQKSSKKIERMEQNLFSQENKLKTQSLRKEIMVLYYEFQEKQKQFQELQYLSLIEKENLNTALIQTNYKKMSYETYTFKKINILWDLKIESIDILRQQHLILLSIFTKSGIAYYNQVSDCIKPVKLPSHSKEIAVQWNIENSELPIHLIIHFLQRKNIDKIFINGKNQLLIHKLKEKTKQTNITIISSLEDYKPVDPKKVRFSEESKIYIQDLEAWIESIIETL